MHARPELDLAKPELDLGLSLRQFWNFNHHSRMGPWVGDPPSQAQWEPSMREPHPALAFITVLLVLGHKS